MDAFRKYMNTQMFLRDLPGLAVSAGTLGREEYLEVCGYGDYLTKRELKPGDTFDLASLSKTFLATAFYCQLEERGASLTEEQGRLLSHTSALRDEGKPLWAPEENRFCYCDAGYGKLSELLPVPWQEYLEKKITGPLAMKQTVFTAGTVTVKGHTKDRDRHIVYEQEQEPEKPGTALVTTLSDMTAYMKAHLRMELLKKEYYASMWERAVLVPNTGQWMTHGWFCLEMDGVLYYGHEGGKAGFRSSMYLSPETGKYALVCSNMTGAQTHPVLEGILKKL